MRITSAGNVGIGTTGPGEKLDVNGTVKATGFQLGTSTTSGYVLTANSSGVGTWQAASGGADSDWTISGNNMYSAVSGNVGIGTTSPGYPLHVKGSSGTISTIEGTVGTNRLIGTSAIWDIKSNGSFSDDFVVRDVNAGKDRLNLKSNGDVLMAWESGGGNVGIGTTAPSYKLDVNGNVAFGTSDSYSTLDLRDGANASWRLNTTGYKLRFMNDNGGTFSEKMVIENSGDVGIGTTSPNSTFETNGSFAISAIREVTSSVTLTATDYIIKANSTTGTMTITLPTAVGIKGRKYIIKRTGTNYVYVSAGALKIDGTGSKTLYSNSDWIEVISDGSNWLQIGGPTS